MCQKLKKIYFILILPACAGFVLAYLLKSNRLLEIGPLAFSVRMAVVLFVLAAVFSIALPIYYRSWFAHRNRHEKFISKRDLLRFEITSISIAMLTPYLALTAFILGLPRFYSAAILLMSLYAAYYFYPSKKRIAFERRIFRVN